MPGFLRASLAAAVLFLGMLGPRINARDAKGDARSGIDGFNKRFVELHLKIDTPGISALWAEDDVDLMRGHAPMIGRKKISAWMEDIVAKTPGYKVTKQEMKFYDIHVCGDWASEWATGHVEVQPPEGKAPINSYGKTALVLHREASGEWKIKQEMWNASPKP